MPRDPLSRTLELIDARAIYAGGFIGGGDWSIRFEPPRKIKFYVIGRGSCLLALEGMPTPFELKEGDVFLMTRNAGFTLATDLSLPSKAAHDVFKGAGTSIVPVGQGDDFFFLGGHLDTNHAGGRLMMENLPDYLHIPASDSGAGRLGFLIGELVEEAASHAPGAEMACSSLAHLLLIQILRRHLSSRTRVEPGWLHAACDPRLAAALALMHSDLSRGWSLVELAQASAMSRTAFATHFRAVAGMPPLAYLTEWRMRQADRALRQNGNSIAQVARSVGYRSEASFGTAFKRVMGRSPRQGAGMPTAEEA